MDITGIPFTDANHSETSTREVLLPRKHGDKKSSSPQNKELLFHEIAISSPSPFPDPETVNVDTLLSLFQSLYL